MSASSAIFKRLKLLDEQELDRLIEKQIRQYDPNLRGMVAMRKEMDEVMCREDLNPEERIALYKSAQQRFLKLRPTCTTDTTIIAAQPAPLIPALPASPAHGPTAQKAVEKPMENARISLASSSTSNPNQELNAQPEGKVKIPTRSKQKYDNLCSLIKGNTDLISLNSSTNELVLDGQTIPKSNFHNLISSLYSSDPKLNLEGEEVFHKALSKLIYRRGKGDPEEFVSRTSKVNQIAKLKGDESDSVKGMDTGTVKQKGQGLKRKNQFLNLHSSPPPPGKSVKVLYLY